MTTEEKEILDKINKYADSVNNYIDPTKVRVGEQLEKLKPVMEEIAKEKNMSVEDVFILYMDLTSEQSAEHERKFQNTIGHMGKYGDVNFID